MYFLSVNAHVLFSFRYLLQFSLTGEKLEIPFIYISVGWLIFLRLHLDVQKKKKYVFLMRRILNCPKEET